MVDEMRSGNLVVVTIQYPGFSSLLRPSTQRSKTKHCILLLPARGSAHGFPLPPEAHHEETSDGDAERTGIMLDDDKSLRQMGQFLWVSSHGSRQLMQNLRWSGAGGGG
eukprot:747193-Hanusia_phi.AAC.3